MKAAVLARGLGMRMRASGSAARLTPAQTAAAASGLKAMMPIGDAGGRTFLDYVLDRLAGAGIDDVAVVAGPEHEAMRAQYDGRRHTSGAIVTCVVQQAPRGTADAVRACEHWAAASPFLVCNGDNLYPADALAALVALDGPGLAAFERGDLERSGNIPPERVASFALADADDAGWLRGLVEKPEAATLDALGDRALVSMNAWRFDRRIFDACRDVTPSARGELELPDAVAIAMTRGVRFRVVRAHGPVLDLSRAADVASVSGLLADGAVAAPRGST